MVAVDARADARADGSPIDPRCDPDATAASVAMATQAESTASARDTAEEVALRVEMRAEMDVLQEELRQAQTNAVLANRQRVDAEVKAMAMRKSMEKIATSRPREKLAAPAGRQRRQQQRRPNSRERASAAQYQLFDLFAAGGRRPAHARAAIISVGPRRQLAGRWAQTWAPAASELDGSASFSLAPQADHNGARQQQRQQHQRQQLAVYRPTSDAVTAVPQRLLRGSYGGITYAQSWQQGAHIEDERSNQLAIPDIQAGQKPAAVAGDTVASLLPMSAGSTTAASVESAPELPSEGRLGRVSIGAADRWCQGCKRWVMVGRRCTVCKRPDPSSTTAAEQVEGRRREPQPDDAVEKRSPLEIEGGFLGTKTGRPVATERPSSADIMMRWATEE